MARTCLKCGFVNGAASGSAVEACPRCGAIYSRVEAIAREKGINAVRRPGAPAGAAPAPAPTFAAGLDDAPRRSAPGFAGGAKRLIGFDEGFLHELRAGTIYPTFRSLIGALYVLGLVCAALWAVGGILAVFIAPRLAGIPALLMGLFLALLTLFLTKLFRELSLMMADLSDASVRTAAALERRDEP